MGANTTIAYAGDHDHYLPQQVQQQTISQQKMEPKMMQNMIKDSAMQKQCIEMVQQPEMQSMMKQMMQKDSQFRKTMMDLVNSVKPTKNETPTSQLREEMRDHRDLH
jgi:hypothetical protein